MKITKKRDNGRILELTEEEARHLWCVVREGRRALAREYAAGDDSLELELLHQLPSDNNHADRMGR